jgi:hypothetical protein
LVLCLRPNETLSDDLEAALFDWKSQEPAENVAGYRVPIREQKENGWQSCPPETRLINRKLVNWIGEMPPDQHTK